MEAGSAPARSRQAARGAGQDRIPELVPIRYGRMLASPFTFYRGAAAIMAMDLAKTPESGLRVQACGDAHLSNFGVFAAPDRRLVLDVNDFDETLPGPWEWDVKRLAASFAIAGRNRDFTPKETRAAVLRTVRAYREAMREFAAMRNLDVWYARLDVDTFLADLAKVADRKQMKAAKKNVAKAKKKNSMKAFDRLVRVVDGKPRIISDPPLLVPASELVSDEQAHELEDGSSRCSVATARASRAIAATSSTATGSSRWPARWSASAASERAPGWLLLTGRDGQDPLFLQAKEAEASVLERYAGESGFGNHGERVVEGQWLMQAASDIFLGWLPARGHDGANATSTCASSGTASDRSTSTRSAGRAGDLRPGLRLDACPSPRAVRRPDRDRVLPREGRDLRPRDRGVLRALRGPERARLRQARGRGEVGPHRGRDGPRLARSFARVPMSRAVPSRWVTAGR